jgi:ketosteroid isomerase-like protein
MKLRNHLLVALAMGALLFTSCKSEKAGTAKVDIEALKPEIQKMEDAYAAAEKAKDADAVVVYYADDATSYNRNDVPSVGKAAIKAHVLQNIAKDTTGNTNEYKIVDLFAEGDMATEIGSTTEVTPAGVKTLKGYYLSIFMKKDGKYQCIRDMNVTVEPVKKP